MPRSFSSPVTGPRRGVIALSAGLLVCAIACGAALASSVTGMISGQVATVSSTSFVVKNSTYLVEQGYPGSSTVSVGKAPIRESVTVSTAALKAGLCITATGTSASGAIDASSITLSAPVKGSCSRGFRDSGHHYTPGSGYRGSTGSGAPPSGSYPTGGTSFRGGSFGFASGSIVSVRGSTLTVKGTSHSGFVGSSASTKPKLTTLTVRLSSSTKLTTDRSVKASAISKGQCAEVNGTSSNGGVTVAATSIMLSAPSSDGCNAPSFGR